MVRVCVALCVAAACGSSNDSKPAAPPPAKPIDAAIAVVAPPPIDAAAPIDAAPAVAPCPPDAPLAHAFAFGSLSVPAGWCWRRTEEGDDQSGVIVDDRARERAVFTQLSHGAKVGDACDAHRPDVRAASRATSHGVAFKSCMRTNNLHCLSFDGDANICSTLPELPGFTLANLTDSITRK